MTATKRRELLVRAEDLIEAGDVSGLGLTYTLLSIAHALDSLADSAEWAAQQLAHLASAVDEMNGRGGP